MLHWIVGLKLFEIGVAIEKLLMIGDSVVLDPIVGTNKAIGKAAHVSLPVADNEIEVLRSIAPGSRRFSCRDQRHLQYGKKQSEYDFIGIEHFELCL